MNYVIFLAAAELLSAPTPNTSNQAGPRDYPINYLISEKSAAAILEIIVTPDGKVAQCQIKTIYGDEKFAKTFCKLQKPRGWITAVDGNGKPAYGVVRTLFRMFIPGTAQGTEIAHMTQSPDIQLTVNKLPNSLTGYHDIKVSLGVDSSGAVIDCLERLDSIAPIELKKIACDQAKNLKFEPVFLGETSLTGYVIEQIVRFQTDVSVKPSK